MLKKVLTIVIMLLTISSILVATTETGSKITRSANDFVRVLVDNTNTGMLAKSGFKAVNDGGKIFQVYIESDSAGANAWLKNDTGDIQFDVSTGKSFKWYIGGVGVMNVTSAGISSATWAGSTIDVAYGGTGVASLTNGGILLGSGTDNVTVMSRLTDGQIVIGQATGSPTVCDAFTSATGAVKHEVGGLEADVSAYSGLIKIAGGVTSNITDKAGLEGCVTDVTDFAEASGDTWSGNHEWWGASILSDPTTGGIRGTEDVALRFEGSTVANDFETFFVITDPTADKVITFQDYSGTVVTDDTPCYDLEGDNLKITDGVLNASISNSDVSIGADNFLYLWATGNTQNDEADNWRCSVGTNSLMWQYYDGASWIDKEEHTP